MEKDMKDKWISVKECPVDKVVDIWSKESGRIADVMRDPDGAFYDAYQCCYKDVDYYMELPESPIS